MKKQSQHPAHFKLTLGLILLVSLILNLWGITYGLPQKYYPDEGRLINHALAFGMGDFNPHYFNYPALSMYILFGLYVIYFGIGYVAGLFPSISDFQRLFFADPTSFYLIGRVWVALTGTAVVALVYKLGEVTFKNRKAGLAAACLLAPIPYFVFYCHFIVTDILLLFFLLLSYIFIIRILRHGRPVDYLAAGAAAGLGIATKYSPGLLILPIFLAHLMYSLARKRKILSISFLIPLALAFGALVLFFFIGSPYCFLDYPAFKASLEFREHLGSEHTFGTGTGTAWLIYPRLLFLHGFNTFSRLDLMGVVFLGGIIWALVRRTREDLLLLAFPATLFILMARWTTGSNRYALPLVIFFAVWSGRAFAEISHSLKRKTSPERWRRWGAALLNGFVALAVCLSLLNAAFLDYRLSGKDTRSLAKEWIEEHIPPGTIVALEWDTEATVQLWETPGDIVSKIKAYETEESATIHHTADQMATVHRMRLAVVPDKNYTIIRVGGMEGTRVKPTGYSLDELRRGGAQYFITSSEVTWIFESERGKEIYPRQNLFYRQVREELHLLKTFYPDKISSLGPVIRIYKF